MFTSLPFDWFILLLRLLFVFLLYFFLYQLVRVTSRELRMLAGGTASAPVSTGQASASHLVVVEDGWAGLQAGTRFALGSVNTIGRGPDCTIVINEPFVSSEHGELRFAQGRWWLRDLGSTNGTYLNGAPVRVATGVKPGDVVQVGRVKLRLVP